MGELEFSVIVVPDPESAGGGAVHPGRELATTTQGSVTVRSMWRAARRISKSPAVVTKRSVVEASVAGAE